MRETYGRKRVSECIHMNNAGVPEKFWLGNITGCNEYLTNDAMLVTAASVKQGTAFIANYIKYRLKLNKYSYGAVMLRMEDLIYALYKGKGSYSFDTGFVDMAALGLLSKYQVVAVHGIRESRLDDKTKERLVYIFDYIMSKGKSTQIVLSAFTPAGESAKEMYGDLIRYFQTETTTFKHIEL